MPYQRFAEEVLSSLKGVVNVNVTLINARDEIVNPFIDMLILVGGADINSAKYGQKPSIMAGSPNVHLEWFDDVMLPQYIARSKNDGMSILGICRGMQALNVHFGGGMIQDFPQENSGETRWKLVDKLECLEPFKAGYEKWKKENKETGYVIEVNSLHHQVCFPIAKELDIIAVNQKFGNVEVIKHKELPILGVQYHPEELNVSPFMKYLMNFILPKVCEI
jgi:putative glutamine amidotransferase